MLQELRVLPDSPARKLVELAGRLEPIAGVGSILAADRIFGLLEREFSLRDIEGAVGRVLRPAARPDLSPHRTLLDLSLDPQGNVRLVTTNFDLLFEAAKPRLQRWTPNQLPDLQRTETFEGIVHLHGMFDESYGKAVGGNLVLSSAEFGRAYLAEGWATRFIRAAIGKYLIVFVGYAADDPPVQYLLEALTRIGAEPPRELYAFQPGQESEAKALWAQKGVHAIAYSDGNGHAALWQTLVRWAERARNPRRWRDRIIRNAQHGPKPLASHERGQVVHLARTFDGARSLAEAKKPIPAEWLCVFDSQMRYATPGPIRIMEPGGPEFDPFSAYGLDSDPQPAKAKENKMYQRRDVPRDVIDVFTTSQTDRSINTNSSVFRGHSSAHFAQLPQRLVALAGWLSRVCGQHAAIWWAAGQIGLHPVVADQIKFMLARKNNGISAVAKQAWRYLFEAWAAPHKDDFMNTYDFQKRITQEGWTEAALRSFAILTRPTVTAAKPYWLGPAPPDTKGKMRRRDLVNLDIRYPEAEARTIEISSAYLVPVLRVLRQNLEYAIALEHEVTPHGLLYICPIEPDPNLAGTSSDRVFGINPSVLTFTALFRRLLEHDREAALREFAAWREDDDIVFGRLRVWAAGLSNLLSDETAGEVLIHARASVFWGLRHQRDVLLTLGSRWQTLPPEMRLALERRLLAGPPPVRRAPPERRRQWHSVAILERVYWLQEQGCRFTFDLDKAAPRLRALVPDWIPQEARRAADSHEGHGGTVQIDKSFDDLIDVPLDQLLTRAMEAQRREFGRLKEYDPFAGLCEKRPVRVLAALVHTTRAGADTIAPWSRFLYAGAHRNNKSRLALLIARRLTTLPTETLSAIIRPVSYWLENVSKLVATADNAAFHAILDRLIAIIGANPDAAEPKRTTTGMERDWVNSADGAAAGHLTSALLADPVLDTVPMGGGMPEQWRNQVQALRDLPGDPGRFVLVQLARHLDWFFAHDESWAENTILSMLDHEGVDRDASLAGFFTNAFVGSEKLYLRLKPILIALAMGGERIRRRYEQALASLFAVGWLQRRADGTRCLSDEEFRIILVQASDDMRAHILWHMDHWQLIGDKLALLKNVWPLQLAARSAMVTGRLCQIAFDDDVHFPELVDAILPLVAPFEGGSFAIPGLRGKEGQLFERHPQHVLALLSTVLPADRAKWPYGTAAALQKLSEVAPALQKDARFISLERISKSG